MSARRGLRPVAPGDLSSDDLSSDGSSPGGMSTAASVLEKLECSLVVRAAGRRADATSTILNSILRFVKE